MDKMKKYLVVGLESSATRLVSSLLALNLNLISDIEDWDAVDQISNDDFLVEHRSLPHGHRKSNYFYIDQSHAKKFDKVIVTTRDINCIIKSKLVSHQPNLKKCLDENKKSIKILQEIINNNSNVHIFSIESAFLLQEPYLKKFFTDMGLEFRRGTVIDNLNEKYIG